MTRGVATVAGVLLCCCCCPCGGPAPPEPAPVPGRHADLLGRWTCADGDTHTFVGAGWYQEQRGDRYEEPVALTTYADGVWTGVGLRSWARAEIRVGTVTDVSGQSCVEIQGRMCARAATVAPALVGRWSSPDGRVEVEVRDDGYLAIREGDSVRDGQLLVVDGQARVQLCGSPHAVPLVVVGFVLVWDGVEMDLVASVLDPPEGEAMGPHGPAGLRAPRSGGSRDFDFDVPDFDFD